MRTLAGGEDSSDASWFVNFGSGIEKDWANIYN